MKHLDLGPKSVFLELAYIAPVRLICVALSGLWPRLELDLFPAQDSILYPAQDDSVIMKLRWRSLTFWS